jgi:hypothetical protein
VITSAYLKKKHIRLAFMGIHPPFEFMSDVIPNYEKIVPQLFSKQLLISKVIEK